MNGYEEDAGYDLALTDALESTEVQLMNNDFSMIRFEGLYRRLCREIIKAKQTYLREEVQRREGRYRSNGISGPQASPVQPKKTPAHPMSKVIPEYLKAFERRAPGTILAKKNVFKRFVSIFGDKPLSSISDSDLLRYRETLARLPTNMGKRYPRKTVKEVLKTIEGKIIDRISLATINMDHKCAATLKDMLVFPYNNYWFERHWTKMKQHLHMDKDKEFIPYCLPHTCCTRLV